MHRAELVVAKYDEEPEQDDVPPSGPGPFSMANADTVSDVLENAGYEDILLARRIRLPPRHDDEPVSGALLGDQAAEGLSPRSPNLNRPA